MNEIVEPLLRVLRDPVSNITAAVIGLAFVVVFVILLVLVLVLIYFALPNMRHGGGNEKRPTASPDEPQE
ncbi:MAG: hypothetical protein Q8K89_02755 [Actinomycetota bacterium]|nr:hypothetical protein [Actinomycetota bacterium]